MSVRTACSASARVGRSAAPLLPVVRVAPAKPGACRSTLTSVFIFSPRHLGCFGSAVLGFAPRIGCVLARLVPASPGFPGASGNLFPAGCIYYGGAKGMARVNRRSRMAADHGQTTGPDLAQGITSADLRDGCMLAGRVGDKAVLLARRGKEIFAVDATCSHYGGPLVDGLMVGSTVRCPWHHACFDLKTGEALHAPAFSPLNCWEVEELAGHVRVRARTSPQRSAAPAPEHATAPRRIVIVGGGAAGFAAAEMLRRLKYQGAISLLSAEAQAPVDRPNLSKDYLAGHAPPDWLPLRPDRYYAEEGSHLQLNANVVAISRGAW